MPARIDPVQTPADRRADRHARTFTASQLPSVDPQVLRLFAQGYVPLQIASILNMPVSDVKLMLSMAAKGAAR